MKALSKPQVILKIKRDIAKLGAKKVAKIITQLLLDDEKNHPLAKKY